MTNHWGGLRGTVGPFVPKSEEGIVIETGGPGYDGASEFGDVPPAEKPRPCGAPGPGGLKPCLVQVQDSAGWVSDGEHDGPHIWWAQEGRTLWIYEENPLEATPRLRLHADLTSDARITVEEAHILWAYAELLAARKQDR